jgi:hypothetical protein
MHVKDYVIGEAEICGAVYGWSRGKPGWRMPKRQLRPRYGNDKKDGENYFLRENLKVREYPLQEPSTGQQEA